MKTAMTRGLALREPIPLLLLVLLTTGAVSCGAASSVVDTVTSAFASEDTDAESTAEATAEVDAPAAPTPHDDATTSPESRTATTRQDTNNGTTVTRTTTTRTSSSSVTSSSDRDERSLQTGGSADACFGDFYLAESVYIDPQAGIGQACEGEMPVNCLDGVYITDSHGSCVCTARCQVEGGQCAEDWTCRAVQATNATGNRAMICAFDGWFLCLQ